MKIFALILFLICTTSCCQKYYIAVAPTQFNILYNNLTNSIIIGITGLKKPKFTLSVDNGKVYQIEDRYFIEPDRLGLCSLSIVINQKHTYYYIFKVQQPQDPETGLMISKHNRNIKSVTEATGVYATSNSGYATNLKVINFDVDVIRDGNIIFCYENNGPLFDSNLRQFFTTLQKGDVVNFYNIIVLYKNGNTQDGIPFSFIEK
ncbi:MAG: hypothetical protein JNL02_13780 [Saprospiraceae bacterium]|nr:hypothetical protein [Saprospiraceae bacterium]